MVEMHLVVHARRQKMSREWVDTAGGRAQQNRLLHAAQAKTSAIGTGQFMSGQSSGRASVRA
jgi:hypothetical protein